MKKQFTREQHDEMAVALYRMRDDTTQRLISIQRTYGTSSKVSKAIERLCDSIDRLRSELDNVISMECPLDDSCLRVYYGRESKGVMHEKALDRL